MTTRTAKPPRSNDTAILLALNDVRGRLDRIESMLPPNVATLRELNALGQDIIRVNRTVLDPRASGLRDIAEHLAEEISDSMSGKVVDAAMERLAPLLPILLAMLPEDVRERVGKVMGGGM